MSVFSRWRDVTFDFEGVEVTLRLRAPLPLDAREIQRRVRLWRRGVVTLVTKQTEYVRGDVEQEPEDTHAMFDRVFADEWARKAFAGHVKLREPIEGDDGKPIEGGAALYDAMGIGERVAILYKLDDLAWLKGTEGKASSSPSTSAAETVAASSPSTATSTAAEVGQEP